jgi:hypothetical protein
VAARERHSKELEVAGLMKVAMVFAHTTLAVTPAYALFLTRIAEGAKQHGAVGAGKFIELPVQVTGTLSLFVCVCLCVCPVAYFLDAMSRLYNPQRLYNPHLLGPPKSFQQRSKHGICGCLKT